MNYYKVHPITGERHRGAPSNRRTKMHFKRKGPKSTRAGCLLCKPHKRQGTPHDQRQRHSVNRRLLDLRQQIKDNG